MTQRTAFHVINGLGVGGAEAMLVKVLPYLQRCGYKNEVISLIEPGPLEDAVRSLGVRVRSLGMRRGLPDPTAVVRLAALLRRERPTILQTWMYHANLLGLVAGRLAGLSRIVWNIRCATAVLHDLPTMTVWTNRACAVLSGWPSATIINSLAGQRFHDTLGYRPERWAMIPNGFDTERFAPDAAARESLRMELGLESSVPIVGLVARLDPLKDHETFLSAAVRVGRQRPDVSFVLVGRGVTWDNPDFADLKGKAIAHRIHMLGERGDIPRLMAGLDVAVSSSCDEGFPNVVGEAMACGVPCVVTDVGDSALIVGDTGAVVPPRDPHALAAAVAEMLSMAPEERQALGRRARDRVREHYSIDAVSMKYVALYDSLVDR